MKVLIIGGTGIISTAVVDLCLEKGYELSIINRGKHSKSKIPGVNYIVSDVKMEKLSTIQDKIGNKEFDAVIDFLSYNVKQLRKTTQMAKCLQYIFISSASIYEEKDDGSIYVENSKKGNTCWDYCKNKYECERELPKVAGERQFNYTIVRPYVTYSNKRFPYQVSPVDYYTIVYRIKHRLPIPIIESDKHTTVTDSRDFATGLVGLIGNKKAFNSDFHITSDDRIRWRDISDLLARCYGVTCRYVEINKKMLFRYRNTVIDVPELLYDKSREMMFDNTKIKDAVPDYNPERRISDSINEVYTYFKDNESSYRINYLWTGCLDRLIADNSDTRVTTASYKYDSTKDKIMYMVGRTSFLCFLYNLARKVYSLKKSYFESRK